MTDLVTTHRGYQKPRPGQKLKDDVLRLIAALDAIDVDVADLLLALAGKSDVDHGHGIAAITGLAAALGSKLDVGYHDALANLTDVDVAGVANGMALLRQASKWIPVALQINNIAGLETALNGKATPADVTAAINALVAAAPGALDTLNELAAALGNDPNFATTITTALAGKQSLDSDLTAIAALSTTAFGRALLTVADAAALRTVANAASADAAIRDDIDQSSQAKASGLKVNILKNTLQAWEHIGSPIDVASAIAQVDWTGLDVYRRLRLRGYFAPAVDGAFLQWRTGVGTFDSGTNYSQIISKTENSTLAGTLGTGNAAGQLTPSAGNSNSGLHASLDCTFDEFNKARNIRALAVAWAITPASVWSIWNIGGLYLQSAAGRDRLRLVASSGNIGAGSYFVLEGIRG